MSNVECRRNSRADLLDVADDLVPGNQWQLRIRQLAIDHVKIGPANCARSDSHEQLSLRGSWLRHVTESQRLPRFIEDHRAHALNINDECRMTKKGRKRGRCFWGAQAAGL